MSSSLANYTMTRARNLALIMVPYGGWLIWSQARVVEPEDLMISAGVLCLAFAGLVVVDALRKLASAADDEQPTSAYGLKNSGFTLLYWAGVIAPLVAAIIMTGYIMHPLAAMWAGLVLLAGLQPATAVLDYINIRRRSLSKARRAGGLTE